MPILDQYGNWLLKTHTASYQAHHVRSFRKLRDLPTFDFDWIAQMLIDPIIRLGLAMRMAPLCQAEFAYKDGEEWVEGVQADRPEVGQYIHEQLRRIWQHELHKILTAQIWGWSAGEVVLRLANERVEVDKILHRHARDVWALHKDGEVQGVRFQHVKKTGRVELRFPKAIWHAFMPEAESSYGLSILHGAFSSWADKWLDGGALDTRRLFMHKDAYGGQTGGYPPGTTNIDGKGEVPNRDIMREMVEQSAAGQVVTVPMVYDPNGKPLWEWKHAEIPANPQHILQYPKDLDGEMLNGMEIPDDVIKSEATGAWQGKQVPMLAFFTNGDRWLAQVVRSIVTQILEPLVMLNWNRAEEFEVQTKPLAEQAMDQIKATEGTEGQPTNGVPAPQNGQPMNPQRFGLDDSTATEKLIGVGTLQAANLVKAARKLLNGRANGIDRLRPTFRKRRRAAEARA